MISKKDLLAATGISYGQLYRWKRERLIPEEWFIKQSSFTGQETFFPKEQIMGRVRSILGMKDDHSLEELARILDTDSGMKVPADFLVRKAGLKEFLADRMKQVTGCDEWTSGEAAFVLALSGQPCLADLEDRELTQILERGSVLMANRKISDTTCTVFRTGSGCHLCLARGTEPPVFDGDADILAVMAPGETANYLKTMER